MNPIVRNIIAVVAGWIVGSVINMLLINTGHSVFPVSGIDINDMDAYASVMPDLEPKYFLFPFLAHAVGTLVGALIAAKVATTHHMKMALIVGGLFLLGGIAVNYMLPGPTWFTALDLLVAYIPMAWLGGRIGMKKNPTK
ncbi:conserved hypothetical protein [Flavobacteria bacterium BBFL7]|nr:conserved hypothetical protein [Flavobacteria bacterium BBFL7]